MTQRTVRGKLWRGFLVCLSLFVATVPTYGQRDENNPDKIGHRTVAHRSIISPEQERAIGKTYADQFDRSASLVQDPLVEQYVTSMAASVVSHSDWKGPVVLKVIKSPRVNSSSFPGGFIYLSSGLLLVAKNDDEIAAVIAHQVAHAAARHWASEATRATILQFSMIPLMSTTQNPAVLSQFLPTDIGDAVCVGYVNEGTVNMPGAFLEDLQRNELEADYLGLQYVYEAGFDPLAYITFLSRLGTNSIISPSQHDSMQARPPLSKRVAQAEKEIRKILPRAPQARQSPDFILMKSHLQN